MAKPPDEPSKQALITALRLLAASPKSHVELEKKLKDKGYPVQAVRFSLKELSEQGVLNDTGYAKNLTNRLLLGKSAGRRQVAFELKRHGIPESIRNTILTSITESSEKERALQLARAKWSMLARLDLQKKRKRIFDHLIRKGYDFSIVRDVLEEISKNTGDEDLE